MAAPLNEAQSDLFRSFAQDVSGGDQEVMAKVDALIAAPPTTLEKIGFYGMEDAPAPERSLRGIIQVLDEAEYFFGVEDKYIYEFPRLLVEEGLAEPDGGEASLDILQYIEGVDWDVGEEPDWVAFKPYFVEHTQKIEQAVQNAGRRLLSLNIPLGDTLYFLVVPEATAKKWSGQTLYTGPATSKWAKVETVEFSVGAPDWASYWSFLTYAFQIPKEHQALPDGLHQ
jgi:hypothetical protein